MYVTGVNEFVLRPGAGILSEFSTFPCLYARVLRPIEILKQLRHGVSLFFYFYPFFFSRFSFFFLVNFSGHWRTYSWIRQKQLTKLYEDGKSGKKFTLAIFSFYSCYWIFIECLIQNNNFLSMKQINVDWTSVFSISNSTYWKPQLWKRNYHWI